MDAESNVIENESAHGELGHDFVLSLHCSVEYSLEEVSPSSRKGHQGVHGGH
jgi:hypothetical protein